MKFLAGLSVLMALIFAIVIRVQGAAYVPYAQEIADQMLPLTTTLHAVVLVPQVSNMGTGLDVTVTPFSELAFQRALARIGAPDSSLASLKALDLGSLQVAQNEALTVFQVRANDPSVLLSQSGSLAQINLGLNGAANYAQSLMNTAMSLGHILLAQQRVGHWHTRGWTMLQRCRRTSAMAILMAAPWPVRVTAGPSSGC